MIFYSCANKIHFYKIGFALTFCKLVYKVKVFGIWIRVTCSAKAVWEKKNTDWHWAMHSCWHPAHPTTLYIQCSCKQGSILRIYTGFAVRSIWKYIYQMQRLGSAGIYYLHSSFHHMIVECLRHPPLGGSGGMRHARPGWFLKLDSLECNLLRSLEGNWLTGKVFWGIKKKSLHKMKHLIWQYYDNIGLQLFIFYFIWQELTASLNINILTKIIINNQ